MRISINSVLTTLIALSIVAVLISSAWHYLVEKDYFFLVESDCDPELETCHYRDCSIEDDCPLGELEYYELNRISAYDFSQCSNITCAMECDTGTLECENIPCEESSGDICSSADIFEQEDSMPAPEAPNEIME
jgi:hypothetical protein